jgi:hypothetical protein
MANQIPLNQLLNPPQSPAEGQLYYDECQQAVMRFFEGGWILFPTPEQFPAALAAGQTSMPVPIEGASFSPSQYSSVIMDYQIVESITGNVRTGRLIVCANGATIGQDETFAETAQLGQAPTGIELSAALVDGMVQISYINTTNACTIQFSLQKFPAA